MVLGTNTDGPDYDNELKNCTETSTIGSLFAAVILQK
jgi:hypothetical protein